MAIYTTLSIRGSELSVAKEIAEEEFRKYIRTVRDLLEWMVNPDPERLLASYSDREWAEASRIKQDFYSGDLKVSGLKISGEEYAVSLGDAIPFPPLYKDTVCLQLDYRA